MQGQILDFSIQQNTGVITGNDQKRYHFKGSEWKEQQHPRRGMQVDFDVDDNGEAIAIYSALHLSAHSNNIIQDFKEKSEDQYSAFDWFLKALKNYVNLNGRARRKEYWFFFLFNMIGVLIAMILDAILGTEVLFYVLYLLAVALPVLGVSVRRLHDIGKSGWWYLVCLIPLVGIVLLFIWFAKEGDAHANQYGQPSK